jgi:tetratricopeptide (TPR) repeat protein
MAKNQLNNCLLAWLALPAIALAGSPVFAQEIPLRRDYPGSGPYLCPAVPDAPVPTMEALEQASQLGTAASQADILGDLDRARELLARAAEVDPSSAPLAYRYGRVLEDLGDRRGAMAQFCRVLALGADAEEFGDASRRLQTLHDESWPEISAEAIEDGRVKAAASSLASAERLAPQWADAAYNQGVVLSRLGRRTEAAAAFRRYLTLDPDAGDAVAVSEQIGELQSRGNAASPPATLTLGMLVPGMGQVYSGRPKVGLTVLGLVGGAVTAGFMVREVSTQCLVNETAFEGCPAGEVYVEKTDRPYLMPALGVAAAVTVVSAIEAFLKARQAPDEPIQQRSEPKRTLVSLPTVSARGSRVDVSVVRITF